VAKVGYHRLPPSGHSGPLIATNQFTDAEIAISGLPVMGTLQGLFNGGATFKGAGS